MTSEIALLSGELKRWRYLAAERYIDYSGLTNKD